MGRQKRIGIGGSASNPPHLAHQHLVKTILESKRFDMFFWIVSGLRHRKDMLIESDHRVAMTAFTFSNNWEHYSKSFSLILYDAYQNNTPTIKWFEIFKQRYPEFEIIWCTGVDSVVPQTCFNGKCEIEARWVEGEKLMNSFQFCILPRPGYSHPNSLSLPPQFELLNKDQLKISSTEIRDAISQGQPFEHLVVPRVADYIKKHNLYGYGIKTKEKEV